MRKCLRCNVETIQNLDVKVEGGAYSLKITLPGIFKGNLSKVRGAVCPSCGMVETYVEDPARVVEATSQ